MFVYQVEYFPDTNITIIDCAHKEDFFVWSLTYGSTNDEKNKILKFSLEPKYLYTLLCEYKSGSLNKIFDFEFPKTYETPDSRLVFKLLIKMPHDENVFDTILFYLEPISICSTPNKIVINTLRAEMSQMQNSINRLTTEIESIKMILSTDVNECNSEIPPLPSNDLLIASGSFDNRVNIWNVQTGLLLHTLIGHTDVINYVVFSPDNSKILSSDNKTAKIWDTETGLLLNTLQWHSKTFSAVFSPDNSKIVSCDENGSLQIWNAKNGLLLKSLVDNCCYTFNAIFSLDNSKIISGGSDKNVKIWDVKTGQLLNILRGHGGFVCRFAVSPDGSKILSACTIGSIKIWNINTGLKLNILHGNTRQILKLKYSSDGTKIISISTDKYIRIWDAITNQLLKTLTGHATWVFDILYSNNEILWCDSDVRNKNVKIWDIQTNQLKNTLIGHAAPVRCVTFSNQ